MRRIDELHLEHLFAGGRMMCDFLKGEGHLIGRKRVAFASMAGLANRRFVAPELLTPVLRIIHRVIARFLLKQAGLKRTPADSGAITRQPISRASARSTPLSPSGRGRECGRREIRVEGKPDFQAA